MNGPAKITTLENAVVKLTKRIESLERLAITHQACISTADKVLKNILEALKLLEIAKR